MELLEILLIVITALIAGVGYQLRDSAAKTQKSIDKLEARDIMFQDRIEEKDLIFQDRLEKNADEHKEMMIALTQLNSRMPEIEKTKEDLGKLKDSDTKQWVVLDKHGEDINNIKKLVA